VSKSGNIAMVSTGDPARDRRELAQAALHQSRIDAGMCPNGCGLMSWDTLYDAHCDVCKFILFTNTPRAAGAA
jgi:hypothetical protein